MGVSVYSHHLHMWFIQMISLSSAPRTVESHFACEIVDFLAPLPFDKFLSLRSTMLKSTGSSWLSF